MRLSVQQRSNNTSTRYAIPGSSPSARYRLLFPDEPEVAHAPSARLMAIRDRCKALASAAREYASEFSYELQVHPALFAKTGDVAWIGVSQDHWEIPIGEVGGKH